MTKEGWIRSTLPSLSVGRQYTPWRDFR